MIKVILFISIFVLYSRYYQPVDLCSESAFDAALAASQPGGSVILACSSVIRITNTKMILKDVLLEGRSGSLALVVSTPMSIFKIRNGIRVTIKHLTLLHGGIENYGMLTVSASRVEASENGVVNYGYTIIDHSTFDGNLRSAVFNAGLLNVRSSLFTHNSRGLDNAHGYAFVINSTFYGNKIPRLREIGAAIANSGTVDIINSTFSDNVAPGGGGAIGNHHGGVVKLTNTILVGKWNCFGYFFDGGHNLQFPGTTCGYSIPTVDPKLQPLADNGGLTQTLALQTGSPAIGAGDKLICIGRLIDGLDARDAVRTACDIGAFAYSSRLLMLAGSPYG